ncbi:UNVERIFIED_CONTAM: hypothetical protein GTU68_007389, partial [Idotea baltica]|nr:hypothetical protein [Idotea baltica]
NFEFKINSNFEDVIKNCSEVTNRKDDGTWITDEIIEAYINLHKAGYAYSVETYLDNKLVGGLYGVSINGMIAGESMFHHIDSASKAALIYLIEYLKNKDVTFIDCQMMTPLFENFGAIDIPRKEFIHLLNQSLKQEKLF